MKEINILIFNKLENKKMCKFGPLIIRYAEDDSKNDQHSTTTEKSNESEESNLEKVEEKVPEKAITEIETISKKNNHVVKCRVCRDKATGYHYGVMTCQGFLIINLLRINIKFEKYFKYYQLFYVSRLQSKKKPIKNYIIDAIV